MPDTKVICDLCGATVPPHEHYLVRIDVFADPSVAAITTEQLQDAPPGAEIAALLEKMKHMTAEELQDGVHRRFEHRLCAACHRSYLTNPLGKPRSSKIGDN